MQLNDQQLTDVENVIRYHAPSEEAIRAISRIRESVKTLLITILVECPPCADRSAAVRSVREAMMTANASIVLGGKNL